MADTGRRDVVRDPLADVGGQVQDRSLSVSGVSTPSNGSPSNSGAAAAFQNALGELEVVLGQAGEISKDKFITQGKMAYMSGKTEADIIKTGNRHTQEGYKQLQTQDGANKWFMEQKASIATDFTKMDPSDYQEHLNKQRQTFLENITDPAAQKIATAAFEQYSPDLVAAQFSANNEYNRGAKINSFGQLLGSTAQTATTTSKTSDGPLKLSDVPTSAVISPAARDRDIGIRTMIGEAASQGSEGLAAVAHVMRNRATDGRWPDSIAGVALQDKQFSAWNKGAGGNHLVDKYGPGNPIYERAGKVFDAVMSGRHVDPTGGATHYYSPAGMTKLVDDGAQSNSIPHWLKAEASRSNGTIRIGGHIFVGRASGTQTARNGDDTPGSEVSGVAPAATSNVTQELILGYEGLSPSDKATAVASQMHAQLKSGDDTLYRDGGGIATLQALNATADQIAQVRDAATAFANKQLDQFDVEDEKWRGEIIAEAESGKDVDGILAKIAEREKNNEISDNEAQSLARTAIEKVRTAKASADSTAGNVPYMTEIGSLYQQIKAGGLDFETAAAEAKRVGEKYGAKPEEVNSVVGQMFSINQSKQDKVRADVEAGKQKYAEAEASKVEISGALARGYGLNQITGDIPSVTASGQKTSISKQEYGIQSIKDKHTNSWKTKLDTGVATPNEAKTGIIVDTFKELQQHQVVDKQTQMQIVGALSGSITDKDGNLTESAQKAYDLWQILRNNPDVQDGYLAQTVGNEEVRGLLETAFILEGGNMTGSEALRRAHELLSDPQRDPTERITKDAIWNGRLETKAREFIEGKTGISANNRIVGLAGFRNTTEKSALALAGKQRAMTFIQNRAEAYHMNNPNLDAEASMAMGLQDLENHMSIVEGNVIISTKTPMSTVMGIEQFGNDAPAEAIGQYLKEYGDDVWGDSFEAGTSPFVNGGKPQFNITMNHANGVLTVDLYKDIKRGVMLGKPQHFDLKAIGKEYYDKKTKLTTWDDMWNGIFKTPSKIGDAVNDMQKPNPGTAIGGMASPVK